MRYTPNPPPTYFMPTDIWRKAPGGAWEQRNNAMSPRRSHAYLDWNGTIVMIGGRDDTNYPTVVDLNDTVISSDGFATFQNLGSAPFRGAYGRRASKFNGMAVLTGGAYGPGGPTTTYLNEVWTSSNPLDPSSWVQYAPMPIACIHHMVGVLTIDGVETLAVIGGYNQNDRPDGSPYGTIYTTTDLTQWVARMDSDFWLD